METINMNHWYVYIMSNKPNGVIYIGVTDNIEERKRNIKIGYTQNLLLRNIIVIS